MQGHLDDELILRALAGSLPLGETTVALEHVAGCGTCQQRLEDGGFQVPRTQSLSGHHSGSSRPASETVEPPARVGRYVIIDRLGEGGMGVVYSAYDPELDRRIAVKVLHLRRVQDHALVAGTRFLREAKAMARLAHPNVIPVYDVGTVDEGVFFAMECIDGRTLRDWLRPGRPWKEVLVVFQQAGRGLAAAHAAGIVHRDFKPENVLIGEDGRVRVTDFGVARALSAESEVWSPVTGGTDQLDPPLTRHGQLLGTPGYLAPEQVDGAATPQGDQFSFCLALFEALTGGQRPFSLSSFDVYLEELRSKRVEFPAGADVPGFVRDAVLRGLEKDPAKRFADMDALLDALARNPRARRLRLAAVVATVVLTSIIGGRALVLAAQKERACTRLAQAVASTWADRRGSVVQAFKATGISYATTALETVNRSLGLFAQRWGDARGAVCRNQAGLPPAQRDTAAACLDHAAQTMDAVTNLLAEADAPVVRHATDMIGALPVVADCLDLQALRSTPPPPTDPDAATAVAAARARLVRAHILAIPRAEEGLAAVRPILDELEKTNFKPALADAYFAYGESELQANLTTRAEESLQRAAELALESRDDRLFIRAASRLAYVLGGYDIQRERAADWIALAERAFRRLGSPDSLRGWLDLQRAGVFAGASRWQECAKAAARATPAARLRGDVLRETEAVFLVSYCESFFRDLDEVKVAAQAALDAYLRLVGPNHPQTANAMASVVEYALLSDDAIGALPLSEQALAVARDIGHPTLQLAGTLGLHGDVLSELGRETEALELRQEALRLIQQVPHSPTGRAKILAGLAATEHALGLHRVAYDHAVEADQICTPEVDKTRFYNCAITHMVFARILLARGERSKARDQALRARAGFAKLMITRRSKERVEAWAKNAGLALPAEERR